MESDQQVGANLYYKNEKSYATHNTQDWYITALLGPCFDLPHLL